MHSSFSGRKIVLGVTGSIALFKVAGWVSTLVKEEAILDVIMTDGAQRFVTPLTFGALTGRKIYGSMFSSEVEDSMAHISLGRDCDCILIAPATAQTIARLANGLADDLLSATVLAARVPVIICPAMNVSMYEHPATQKNISVLKGYGYQVIDPDSGMMACGDEGKGRLPEWEHVSEFVLRTLCKKDLKGQRVLVTAGPTREILDPARFLSNRSSGKMGYAIARAAFRRGAEVILISGPTALKPPPGVKVITVESARQMYDAVMAEQSHATVIVKSAAVSDFRFVQTHAEKIKKTEAALTLNIEKTKDILKELGNIRNSRKQLLVGFAAESSNIEKEGLRKLQEKKLDLIAVNDISSNQAGFAVDTNQLTLINHKGSVTLPHVSKIKTADLLWDYIIDNDHLKTKTTGL